MADLPARQEWLLKQIISTKRCRVCRCGFQRNQVRVAARHDELWLVSVRCARCRHQQVYWIEPDHDVPDNILEDVAEPEGSATSGEPISYDDVFEMHEFLVEFSGDFNRLFGES